MTKKFKYPLAIEGTPEQLESIMTKLNELGYEPSCGFVRTIHDRGVAICTHTSFQATPAKYNLYADESKLQFERIQLNAINEELVLALAAMVDDDQFYEGEIIVLINNDLFAATSGTLAKVRSRLNGLYFTIDWLNDQKGQENGKYSPKHFRKATKEEIIAYFDKKTTSLPYSQDLGTISNITSAPVFVLPEKWKIQVTAENEDTLANWRDVGHLSGIGGWILSSYSDIKGYWFSDDEYTEEYKEITFEQFKTHVLKQNQMLPEKWFIRRNPANAEVLNKWNNETYINSSATLMHDGVMFSDKNYIGTFVEADLKGYKEITFEQFKQYVLNKEKKIIGYKTPIPLFNGVISLGVVYKDFKDGVYYPERSRIPSSKAPMEFKLPQEIVETWEPVYEESTSTITIGKPACTVVISSDGKVNVKEHDLTLKITEVQRLITELENPQKKAIPGGYEVKPIVTAVHIGCSKGPDITIEELKSVVKHFDLLPK